MRIYTLLAARLSRQSQFGECAKLSINTSEKTPYCIQSQFGDMRSDMKSER